MSPAQRGTGWRIWESVGRDHLWEWERELMAMLRGSLAAWSESPLCPVISLQPQAGPGTTLSLSM